MDEEAFWYAAGIKINDRATKYTYGTVEAINEYKALDEVERRCQEEHGGPMCEGKLHRIDKTTGEREGDACLIVTDGRGNESRINQARPESSQASEKSTDSKSPPAFGTGWARKLPDPNPTVPLKHKDT